MADYRQPTADTTGIASAGNASDNDAAVNNMIEMIEDSNVDYLVNKEHETFLRHIKFALDHGYYPEVFERLETSIRSFASSDFESKLYNKFTIVTIPTFFNCTFKLDAICRETVIIQASVIRLFLNYFGKSCIEFKSTINNFTSKVIQKYLNDETIMLKVSQYIALYPLCCITTLDHHGWKQQFDDFVYSADYFLKKLYSHECLLKTNVKNRFKGMTNLTDFNLLKLVKFNPKRRYKIFTSVFMFFMMGIQSMLLSRINSFTKADFLDSTKVNKLVDDALSVHKPPSLLKLIENRIAFHSVLQKIHCTAIETLLALIKCLGKNLIPQDEYICRIIFQYLNKTHFSTSTINGKTKSNSKQRTLIYQILSSWVSETKSTSSLMKFRVNLVSGFIYDIKYDKPSINVKADDQTNKIKKIKINASKEQVINYYNIVKSIDLLANKNLVIEAHTTIQKLLNNSTFNLEPLQFQFLQNAIRDLLLNVIKCQLPTDYPLPYFDGLCRLNLFKSLMATIITSHPGNDMPASEALQIFSSGTTDHDKNVKEFCILSLTRLEMHFFDNTICTV